jgi:hypothetical protein
MLDRKYIENAIANHNWMNERQLTIIIVQLMKRVEELEAKLLCSPPANSSGPSSQPLSSLDS